MIEELHLQKTYLDKEPIQTLYFGGGTPSLLTAVELERFLETVHDLFEVDPKTEITLEANPDDMDLQRMRDFKNLGVNRLSIGIQSFQEEVLRFLNRAHTGHEALDCLDTVRSVGYDNISIDLIYGIPMRSDEQWRRDLRQLIAIGPEHISAYCLTIEEKTVFGNWLKKGKLAVPEEETAAKQFEILLEELCAVGYEQYEISNFCLQGFHSKHNSNYWRQEKYLGIGPSAHSYNGLQRQYNLSHNLNYVKAIKKGTVPCEVDVLAKADHINEYILTTLRTVWGTDFAHVLKKWSTDLYEVHHEYIQIIVAEGLAVWAKHTLSLTDKGKLLADKIAADLFLE